MGSLQKTYPHRRFTYASLVQLVHQFLKDTGSGEGQPIQTYGAWDSSTKYSFDTVEEFGPVYEKYDSTQIGITGADDSSLQCLRLGDALQFEVRGKRDLLTKYHAIADQYLAAPESWTANPVIFIGHGHDVVWKDLRDHLRDKQLFKVEFFESETRVGNSIGQILRSIRAKTGCAVLVYSGEDKLENGTLRPRPNVIHECGFFTAGLEYGHTFVLREKGVEVPTNQAGEQYIEYERGAIAAAFGDVVAAIRKLVPRA